MIKQAQKCWECIDEQFSEIECHECCQDNSCTKDHWVSDRNPYDYQG